MAGLMGSGTGYKKETLCIARCLHVLSLYPLIKHISCIVKLVTIMYTACTTSSNITSWSTCMNALFLQDKNLGVLAGLLMKKTFVFLWLCDCRTKKHLSVYHPNLKIWEFLWKEHFLARVSNHRESGRLVDQFRKRKIFPQIKQNDCISNSQKLGGMPVAGHIICGFLGAFVSTPHKRSHSFSYTEA